MNNMYGELGSLNFLMRLPRSSERVDPSSFKYLSQPPVRIGMLETSHAIDLLKPLEITKVFNYGKKLDHLRKNEAPMTSFEQLG